MKRGEFLLDKNGNRHYYSDVRVITSHTKESLKELGNWIQERKTMEKHMKRKTKSVTVNKINGYVSDMYCDMYQCPACGKTIVGDDSSYCSGCGRKIRWTGAKKRVRKEPARSFTGDSFMKPAPPVGKP